MRSRASSEWRGGLAIFMGTRWHRGGILGCKRWNLLQHRHKNDQRESNDNSDNGRYPCFAHANLQKIGSRRF